MMESRSAEIVRQLHKDLIRDYDPLPVFVTEQLTWAESTTDVDFQHWWVIVALISSPTFQRRMKISAKLLECLRYECHRFILGDEPFKGELRHFVRVARSVIWHS
jgi:hypothetical protein